MTNHRLGFIGLVIALVIAGLLALYSLAGFLLLPWLAQRHLPQYLEERLGRDVSVASLHVNPFLLQVEVRGLSVEGRHGRPVLASERLFADLAISGLFRRAWTFDEFRLEGLRVNLVMAPDGSLNVVEVARRLGGEDGVPGKAAPALVIHSLSVPEASLVFSDLTGSAPASALIDAVSLEAEGISTMDPGRGRHRLDAKLAAGGTLHWAGELVLQPSLSAEGEVQVTGLKAKTLWPFLRDELRLSEVRATSALTGRYAYDAARSLRLSNVTAEISDLVLAGADSGDRLLALETLVASGGSLDLARRTVDFSELALRKGQGHLAIAADGSINWARLRDAGGTPLAKASGSDAAVSTPENAPGDAAAGQAPLSKTADAGSGWSLAIEAVRVAEVGVNAIDRSRKLPLALEIGEVHAQMKLSLALQGATQVVAQGITGSVNRASLGVLGAEVPATTITSAALQNGHFDLQARQLGAQQLAVEGGRVSLQRQPDGSVPLLDLLAGPAAPSDADAGRSWRYALETVRVASFELRLEDQGTEPPLALGAMLHASATPVAVGQPVSFEASLALREGGTINVTGSVAPGAVSVQAQLGLESVALVPLQPLLAQYAALSIQSGAVSASLALRLQQGEGEPLQGNGSLRIADLLVNEATSGDRFLSWRQLDAQGVDFALGARTVAVKDVSVEAPGAKIVIVQDRSVNLEQVLRTAGGPAPEPVGDRPRQPAPAADDEPPSRFPDRSGQAPQWGG